MSTEYKYEYCTCCKENRKIAWEYDSMGRRAPSRRCTHCDSCLDWDVRIVKGILSGTWEALKFVWGTLTNYGAYKQGYDHLCAGLEPKPPYRGNDLNEDEKQLNKQYMDGYYTAQKELIKRIRENN